MIGQLPPKYVAPLGVACCRGTAKGFPVPHAPSNANPDASAVRSPARVSNSERSAARSACLTARLACLSSVPCAHCPTLHTQPVWVLLPPRPPEVVGSNPAWALTLRCTPGPQAPDCTCRTRWYPRGAYLEALNPRGSLHKKYQRDHWPWPPGGPRGIIVTPQTAHNCVLANLKCSGPILPEITQRSPYPLASSRELGFSRDGSLQIIGGGASPQFRYATSSPPPHGGLRPTSTGGGGVASKSEETAPLCS